jgi:ABC-2 type transport system ATP-binding protein
MIEVDNITKYFGPKLVLDNISFNIEKGEIVGFLGPNGAGKTTTMRILTCFFPPTSGNAWVAGYNIFKNPLDIKKRIGYLPENISIYGNMQVKTYLNFVSRIKGIKIKEIKDKVAEVIEKCGLEDVYNKFIHKLSKGYRQRVGLAQALLSDPEVLILDEPTIGLDPKQIIEIRRLIKDLGKEKTIILSTHILPEVSMICQRVIIINNGRLMAVDTPENLTGRLKKSAEIYLKVEGPPTDVTKKLKAVEGIVDVEKKEKISDNIYNYIVRTRDDFEMRKRISDAIFKNGWGLIETYSKEMSLEDIFIKIVTEEKQ